MRILFCGSREWSDRVTVYGYVKALKTDDIVVEGCARGADRLVEQYARELGLTIEHHPADWSLGRRAGIMRTLEMLDYPIPDRVIAFWDGASPGTAFTIRTARRRKIPVTVIRSR